MKSPLRLTQRRNSLFVAALVLVVFLAGLLAFAIVGGVTSEPQFPALGVGLSDRTPVLYFKLCHGRSVGRVVLGRADKAEPPYRAKAVWTAVLAQPSLERENLPIASTISGYSVMSTLPQAALAPGETYVVTAATDARGTNILQSVLAFNVEELKAGFIVSNDATMNLTRWLGPSGPPCG